MQTLLQTALTNDLRIVLGHFSEKHSAEKSSGVSLSKSWWHDIHASEIWLFKAFRLVAAQNIVVKGLKIPLRTHRVHSCCRQAPGLL